MREKKHAVILIILVLAIALVIFLSPIAWMVLTSFKEKGEYFTYPPVFISKSFNFSHFARGLQIGGQKGIADSFIVASLATLLSMTVGALAAYSLARFRIGGKNLAFWILSIRMMPPIASVLPLFLFYRFLRILDTYQALVITYSILNIPFAVWMLKGFFEELPVELEDAALVDGCGRFGAFYRVALPLIAPGLVATALFCFIFSWNEFFFALILSRSRVTPVTVVISGMIGGHEILWAEISAVATMASFPVIAIAIILQRYLVRGLTLGAVKG
ncbi:MAG: carbohydrate ABC transporter permease [Spirochaetota bacterium]